MPSHTALLIKLFSQTNRFHVRRVGGFVFLFRNLDDLTAICSPRLRKRDGESALDYEFGLTTLRSASDRENELIKNLEFGRYVILPKVTSPKHTLDKFIYNDEISEWLLSDMSNVLDEHTMPREQSLILLRGRSDRLLVDLEAAFKDKFTAWILDPLNGPAQTD